MLRTTNPAAGMMFQALRADAVVMQHTQGKRKKNAASRRSWADMIATPAPSAEQADAQLAKTRAMFGKTKGAWASDVLKLRKSGRAALTWSENDSARKPSRKSAA